MTTIGAAHAEFEVEVECELSGSSLVNPWLGNTDCSLEVNALAISGPECEVVLISIDTLYANELYRQLSWDQRYEHVHLVCLASHTHYAPSMVPEYGNLGKWEADVIASIVGTTRLVVDQALEQSRSSKSATWASSISSRGMLASARRRSALRIVWKYPFVRKKIIMAPDCRSGSSLPVQCILLGNDEQKVVIWAYPCHPTGFPVRNTVSSEFPGHVRNQIREDMGADTTVLFLQGAGGDIRQPFFSNNPFKIGWALTLRSILNGFSPVYFAPVVAKWHQWVRELAGIVAGCLASCKSAPYNRVALAYQQTSCDINGSLVDGHSIDQLVLKKVEFNEELSILTVNGEVTRDLWRQLQPGIQENGHQLLFGTCEGQCLGYLVTDEEFAQGGYESTQWTAAFGSCANVRKGATNALVRLIARLQLRSV